MLLYLSTGERRYDRRPVPVTRRTGWEFQAVVAGRCAPVPARGEPLAPTSDCIWVFPPWDRHGWSARPGEPCDVVVMHFSTVPDPVREAVERHGHLRVPLTPAEKDQLRAIAEELTPHYRTPTSHSPLYEQRAVVALSFLVLKQQEPRPVPALRGAQRQKTEQALAWYAEHLDQRPSVEQVAAAVHVSAPHLRRLFQATRATSPRQAMLSVQLERAKELMSTTDWPLKRIAPACGFSGPTVFSRAFAVAEAVSPQQWRDTQIIRRHTRRP